MDNRPSWFVSVCYDGGEEQTSRFIREGFWENYYSEKSGDLIKEIKIGDRIALKATHNKKNKVPFNTNGKIVSVMEIKAIGIVTRNYYDGKKIAVNWTKVERLKEWYFFTFIRSIWKIKPNPKNWMSKELIDFTFNNMPQDINRFRNEPYWKKRFMKDVTYTEEIITVLKQLDGEAHLSYIQEEIRKRKKIKDIEKNPNWRAEIRFTLQKQSSDSKSFANGDDLFYRKSFASEVWGLREMSKKPVQAYSKDMFLAETLMEGEKYDEICSALKEEKRLIIKRVPGAGKKFMAKRLAYSLLQEKDEERVLLFKLSHNQVGGDCVKNSNNIPRYQKCDSLLDESGFMAFCQKAITDHRNDYYFIIDEINRENLNTILVDLLLLFKRDKMVPRDSKNKPKRDRNLWIPENLYIIGMMDMGDLCLRLIDEKLKQYFRFVELEPAFGIIKFSKNNKQMAERLSR
ncbi:MAG: hypothetical protein Q7J41_04795 [Acetobacterium sp.]|nr:hypothetical protein [Acetobacterium sp.]PKM75426.1 MAG: hypothetical protein CVU92_01335 [Firmicutes bacterium HGW-Firmicutes-17]